MTRKRLDVILVERGLADSRTSAQGMIMAGLVMMTDGAKLTKAGALVEDNVELRVKQRPRYVSRAGDKLASVAPHFGIDFADKVVLDVGSSTGGFTDYALQHGAKRIYCVDVGTGQLAYRLRSDSRIVVMERTDIRKAILPELADLAVADLSFISLKLVMGAVVTHVKKGGIILAMAKPQFEAGKALADKHKGIIPIGRDRDAVLDDLRTWLLERWEVVDEADSKVAGSEGNIEHFFMLKR